jgi:hypothetical protein
MINGRVLFASDKILLFEQPPATRLVNLYDGSLGGKKTRYLSFPYVQYMFRKIPNNVTRYCSVSNGKIKAAFHVTVSNEPMTAMNHVVHVVPLPHAFDDASYCIRPRLENTKTLSEMFELTIQDFWRSQFTHCTGFLGSKHAVEIFKNYKNWEDKSKENPEFILETKWKYPMDLSKLPYRPYAETTYNNNYVV